MNNNEHFPPVPEAGVVGIGLMGSSIVVMMLIAGHKVTAVAPIADDLPGAAERIRAQLRNCAVKGLLSEDPEACMHRLTITEDYQALKNCRVVMECVLEDIAIKQQVYSRIAEVVASNAIIGTNTSAIAISQLQQTVSFPQRFLGIHWAEPAYTTRFLEITLGELSDAAYAEELSKLAQLWKKEPTILRKDIRGFITNRLMYAVYREIFHLVQEKRITIEDADKAFRYDAGSWITVMGIFRRMDYLGIADFISIFDRLFPRLSNSEAVPGVMQEIVNRNGRGVQNLIGLYPYTQPDADKWKAAFADFNDEIFRLAALYPSPEKDNVLA